MLIVGKSSIFFGRSVNVQFKPETVTLYYNDAHIKSAITSMLIPRKYSNLQIIQKEQRS